MEKIAIIMPARNEEKRIKRTLKAYSEYFEGLRKRKILEYKMIIAVNNSQDKTLEIAKQHSKNNKNAGYLDLKRPGKGNAIIEGFKEALKSDCTLIGFVDADMSTKPESFYDLIEKMGENHATIASRYVQGAVVEPKQSFRRIIASRIFNTWIRMTLFLNYKDTQCGAKIFRREAIEKVLPHLSVLEWAFDVDILYTLKKLGFTTKEVPTFWSDKNYSTINFARSGPKMALTVLKLRLLNSPLKIFMNSEKK